MVWFRGECMRREEGFKAEHTPAPVHHRAADGAELGQNHAADVPGEPKHC